MQKLYKIQKHQLKFTLRSTLKWNLPLCLRSVYLKKIPQRYRNYLDYLEFLLLCRLFFVLFVMTVVNGHSSHFDHCIFHCRYFCKFVCSTLNRVSIRSATVISLWGINGGVLSSVLWISCVSSAFHPRSGIISLSTAFLLVLILFTYSFL